MMIIVVSKCMCHISCKEERSVSSSLSVDTLLCDIECLKNL